MLNARDEDPVALYAYLPKYDYEYIFFSSRIKSGSGSNFFFS